MPVEINKTPRQIRLPKGNPMDVLVTKTTKASPDGIRVERFEAGVVYTMTEHCARHALVNGWGVKPDAPPESVSAEPSSPALEANPVLQEFTLPDVRALVADMEDIDELKACRLGEQAHSQHKGGRKGVLAAIDERIAALDAANDEPEE